MAISRDEVQHIASLARLELTADEVERFRAELSTILDYVAKLGELEAGRAAEPEAADQPLRPDRVENCDDADAIRREVPELVDGYVRVPRVVE